MELCYDNLTNIIKQKLEFFGRKKTEQMSRVEYYISCHLFKELLECVQHLHESDPPIIHRDLKPDNVLITFRPRNDKYLKLCDFGLSKFDEKGGTNSHTRFMGTINYMAPEVHGSAKYNVKADIYSLGIISKELFDINLYE